MLLDVTLAMFGKIRNKSSISKFACQSQSTGELLAPLCSVSDNRGFPHPGVLIQSASVLARGKQSSLQMGHWEALLLSLLYIGLDCV